MKLLRRVLCLLFGLLSLEGSASAQTPAAAAEVSGALILRADGAGLNRKVWRIFPHGDLSQTGISSMEFQVMSDDLSSEQQFLEVFRQDATIFKVTFPHGPISIGREDFPLEKVDIFTDSTTRLRAVTSSTTTGDAGFVADTDATNQEANCCNQRLSLVNYATGAIGDPIGGTTRAGNAFLTKALGSLTIVTMSARPLTFGTNDTERLRIAPDGAVSMGFGGGPLGTYAPKVLLANPGGMNLSLSSGTNTNGALVSRLTTSNNNNANAGNEGSVGFYGITSIDTLLSTATGNANGDSGGELAFSTKGDAGLLAERVRISAAGNVGIRTADPLSALHVPDGFYAQFQDNSAGAPPAGDCDSDTERGRFSIDTTNNRLYICNGMVRGWDYIVLTD